MLRLLAISVLLTIVYSWEDFRQMIRVLAAGLLKRDPGHYYLSRLDQLVGTLVLLATIPFGLAYFLVSRQPLGYRLAMLAMQLLAFAVTAAGVRTLLFWMNETSDSAGPARYVPLVLALGGMFSPVAHLFSGSPRYRGTLAKFAFLMSIPPLVGLLLQGLLRYSSPTGNYLPNLDLLVGFLVGALFIRITIEFLERYFRLYRLEGLFSYVRIVLGIALAATLALGLI